MTGPLEEIYGITRRYHRKDIVLGKETLGYRITPRAWKALAKHYGTTDLCNRVLAALEPLAPIAYTAFHHDHVLCTNYDFDAKNGHDTLWYVPNQHGGITIKLPEDP